MIRNLAVCALVVVASGCATLPPAAEPHDWPLRRAALQALDRWKLDGRIAVAAGEKGFSGGIDWTQQGASADIEISGPMGGKLMDIRLEGGESVVSTDANGRSGEVVEPDMEKYLGPGQSLPIEEMRYWLVGAPAPDAPHEETLGRNQRLASLSQSGWQVRYERYEPVGAIALPSRIEMTTAGLRLRVAVSDWRLPP
ncbi:MAG: lipoprotein insertase outer membrane protein LolB [Steroidobacteraceae bacterium]